MKRKKIPRKAVERLMTQCEFLSKESEQTAAEIFTAYVELMSKYADYFFRAPWGRKEEAAERFGTMLLRKNINLATGFVELIGPFWTWQAFHEEFIRPTYAPVQELFDKLSEGNHEQRTVLATLKAQFEIERGCHRATCISARRSAKVYIAKTIPTMTFEAAPIGKAGLLFQGVFDALCQVPLRFEV